MKIATWNVDRLRHKRKLNNIIAICEDINADILVLTEADERIVLPIYQDNYCFTDRPEDHELPQYVMPIHYENTERRIIIYSKYPIIRMHETYDKKTACCVEVEIGSSPLLIYGTIIGIHAWQRPYFEDELEGTLKDIEKFTTDGYKICCLGDFNCSFSDNYFCKDAAREEITECFTKCNMRILTKDQPQCIDHIAISEELLNGEPIYPAEWNQDLKLSDHKGISLVI